jgi:hypothetical protein
LEPPVNKDPQNPTDFSGPPMNPEQLQQAAGQPEQVFVAPGMSAVATDYEAKMRARRPKKTLPKTTAPVGGVPMPQIPRLDGDHQTGMTMDEQARQQRQFEMLQQGQGAVAAGHHDVTTAQSIVEPPPMAQIEPQATPAALGIQPADVLPEEATRDPDFIQGHGAMVAASQPRLAMKYGVIRGGKRLAPQQLMARQQGAPQLRPQTVQDIETLGKLQEQQQGEAEVGLPKTDEEAQKGLPDAARAAQGTDPSKPLTKEQLKRLQNMDELDLESAREKMRTDILQNQSQRDIIEGRLEPMKIEDLMLQNVVMQRVPIVPGTFEPTFRSVGAEEDLAIKRLIMEESNALEVSDRYLLDKYSIMGLTLGLFAVGGKPLPEHFDEHGNFSDDKFRAKLNRVCKLPTHMIASLATNYGWFEERVRRLFVAEKVGNG